jgi:hypothetical protein
MPSISVDSVRFSTLWLYVAGCLVVLIVVTLSVLWIRRRSVLDLWLMVVMCAYLIEICLISFPVPVRYSIGWYAGRVFGLVSGSLVLFVLLYEITMLYAQLLRAVLAQRREREARLMTGDAVAATIAHEVKQPLSGMVTNADAGLRWLDRPRPDLDEAKAAFKKIAADGHRAGAVIGSIRAIFKRDTRSRTSLDINDLIGEALVLLRGDLQKHRILVQTEADAQLPQVVGDRIQLQQVLLNLITNASSRWPTRTDLASYRLNAKSRKAGLWCQWRIPELESACKISVGYSTRSSRQNRAVWGWACRSAAPLSRPMVAACWLLRTPLGALYFNLSWPLVRRHPPRLRDEQQATHFALPVSTRLIRMSQ